MSRLTKSIVWLCLVGMLAGSGRAQSAGLGLRPMQLEIEVVPGTSRTASFLRDLPKQQAFSPR